MSLSGLAHCTRHLPKGFLGRFTEQEKQEDGKVCHQAALPSLWARKEAVMLRNIHSTCLLAGAGQFHLKHEANPQLPTYCLTDPGPASIVPAQPEIQPLV